MLARWPIRNKLLTGIGLLLVIVATLSVSGFSGVYAYRGLVRSLRGRADELPLASALSQQVSDCRATVAAASTERSTSIGSMPSIGGLLLDEMFRSQFNGIVQTLDQYRDQLSENNADDRIGDSSEELAVAARIQTSLDRVTALTAHSNWGVDDEVLRQLNLELEQLQQLTAELPSHLHRRLAVLAGEVRTQYRSLIAATGITTIAAAVLLAVFIRLFYGWVFRPLRLLVKGSRRVAAGDFGFRIQLESQDEMAELADAMNAMTARFQAIRDDLDRQVQLRTKQVVRSEQLASVGFLAAGVAHEINNPLASIAMCAESLESRLEEACGNASGDETSDSTVASPTSGLDPDTASLMRHYLQLIQTEAFRCKGITEKLLDFSRLGDVSHQPTDLIELVGSVIEMVRHLGKYHDKQIVFDGNGQSQPVIALVNAQEIKQVVLNLITNALDSLEAGGSLCIDLHCSDGRAEMIFADNGCGMTDEVLAHLFEPFFTRKRGGQGTGLGLSIVYRIVIDHGGEIEAESEGPGHGSRFRVALPLAELHKEKHHRYQAA